MKKKHKKLILVIDGNFFAWRAYSTRNLSTSTGTPTSVISGMLQMIKNLFNEFRYDRLVICWDSPLGSQFRKKIYPEYKANRKDAKEKNKSLFVQMDSARDFFKSLNVRQAILPGIEGDDIISLVAIYYASHGHESIIASADRDLLQLISPGVKIYRPNTKQLVGEKEFRKMYDGLPPSDLIKIKSLMGDKGDNIPGVQGIGERGAIQIVKEFKTLRNIMNKKTTNRKILLIRNNIKTVELAYKLVKIIRNPLELPPESKKLFSLMMKSFKGERIVDWSKMKRTFRVLELRHRNFNALAEQFTLVVD